MASALAPVVPLERSRAQAASMRGTRAQRSARRARVLAHDPTGPILLVESDLDAARAVMEQMLRDGYQCELARSADHARALAARSRPRLIMLGELGAPRGAFDLLEEIRQGGRPGPPWAPEAPVIVIGSGQGELDMLRAFEAGADDFVVPAGSYLELRVRIRALLGRVERPSAGSRSQIAIGALRIDTGRHVATMDGAPIVLRRLEFQLLTHLASDPERVFTRQELLQAVWGYRSRGSTRTVDSHASRLRRKLEVHGGRWVINVWGIGYRLC